MKFIRFGTAIFETNSLVIMQENSYDIVVSNSNGFSTKTYDTEEMRNAAFDALEKMLMHHQELSTKSAFIGNPCTVVFDAPGSGGSSS